MVQKNKTRRKIRYAVVGLGHISQMAVLPAFQNAKRNSEVVAFVSDSPEKMQELGAKYNVELMYSYAEYEHCLQSGKVDAVYIALPNHLHKEYAVRAARAGVHVLCEKPMAVTEQECLEMINAARDGNAKLMVSYRLHFEKGNLKAVEITKSGALGDPRLFHSAFSLQVKEGNIRVNPIALGGGPLYDLGIYCINASRYLFQSEPTEVTAFSIQSQDPRFQESEETLAGILRFPNEQVAEFVCSFGACDVSMYQLVGTKGSLMMDPAYDYANDLQQKLMIEGEIKKQKFKRRDQFAPVLLYFSDCIRKDLEPEPSGWEGLADVRIIQALYRSVESREPVRLEPFERREGPSMEQEIHEPPVEKPDLVHADQPSRE